MASGDTLLTKKPQDNEPPETAFATLDTRNAHPVLDFDGSVDEEAVFTDVMPRHYSNATGIRVVSWWMLTSATTGSFRVQVAVERCDAALDLDADSFAAFESLGASAPATSGFPVAVTITLTAGAQMDSVVAGDVFRLKIRRDADGTSGTDDITTDAELLAVEVREA